MKKLIFSLLILSLCFYGCKSHSGHHHEGGEEHASLHSDKEHKHEEHDHDHDHDHKHDEHDHEHDHEHEHGNHQANAQEHVASSEKEHSDEIIFTQAQAAKTDFEVSEILPTTFHQVIRTSGQIQPAPGDESVIVATSNGLVSFHNNATAEGTPVKKGQLIFNIASKNIAEGDHYSKVKANYERARSEYERAQSLVKDRIISQREFENIQLEFENAKIAFDAISGNKTAKGVGITSPMNGYLKNILVKEGEYISVGQPLATVSQNQRLILRAEVTEKHYPALKSIESANFKTPYDNKVYVLKELNGRLLSFGKASGTNSFYIPVSFEFDNKGEVIPGSFVEVYLIGKPLENTLVVPVSALTNEMGTYYVYVQLDEEGYRKQEVTPGANNGKEVQILKGLKAGDRVVTKGAYQVKMAAASGAIPHGHSHEH